MAEHTQRRWRCDHCGRDVKKGDTQPPGWHESSDYYGNTWHCCSDVQCVTWMARFNAENGHDIPESILRTLAAKETPT